MSNPYIIQTFICQTFKPEYNGFMPKRYFSRFGNSVTYTRDKDHPSLYRRILAVLRRKHFK
jgi:hypothetical protein